MGLTKEDYEARINSSPVFFLKKDENPAEYDVYKRMLYSDFAYYFGFGKEKLSNYYNYGIEIIETIDACLRSYQYSEEHPFLHYFNVAFSRVKKKARAKQIEEEYRSGVRISEKDSILLSKFINLLSFERSRNPNDSLTPNNKSFLDQASQFLGVSTQKVCSLWDIFNNLKFKDVTRVNDEGEESSLFETEYSFNPFDEEPDESKTPSLDLILSSINEQYHRLQERSKPIMKDIVTVFLLKTLGKEANLKSYHSVPCINPEIIQSFYDTQKIPSYEEIAKKYDKLPASISRMLDQFREKIKQALENQNT